MFATDKNCNGHKLGNLDRVVMNMMKISKRQYGYHIGRHIGFINGLAKMG